MRLLVQRIRDGWVDFAGDATPRVGAGLLALIGFCAADAEALLEPMATKLLQLRILSDEQGRMNRSLADTGGSLMLVSQFTLYADCSKGRRPSFLAAMPPVPAEALYDRFVAICHSQGAAHGIDVVTGRFGAAMSVHLVNDGPVTILLDSEELGLDPARAASGV
jgi:D-tyrosyl-tRNA(Tyr) deacylase